MEASNISQCCATGTDRQDRLVHKMHCMTTPEAHTRQCGIWPLAESGRGEFGGLVIDDANARERL